ncbi:uncharacterized protein LOC107823434 [Nicotiana tabacum]|uniref:Protein SSUH2 homolog n=2 Tax=Nicotiana TaxID=4085 RepID=A0A1S4CWP8_TOBAC|nr:PREDICTED: protein SSUH2 homolog [Nicotiana sylvestris]XP_016505561.1 PREDICTED: protein SSUH2 homolog [Nicotiana tabacum]
MASLQCHKPAQHAPSTVCQKTTTVTCHKANNEHHSYADKMKDMTVKMFHHDNHNQHSACYGTKTNQSAACHGTKTQQSAACHGTKPQQSAACHGTKPQQSAACHGTKTQQSAACSGTKTHQSAACHGTSATAAHAGACGKKKEGNFMHKMRDQMRSRRNRNKDGSCSDGSDNSSSSSDESDDENCGRTKKRGNC